MLATDKSLVFLLHPEPDELQLIRGESRTEILCTYDSRKTDTVRAG